MSDSKNSILYLSSHKVIVDGDMLHSRVEDRILTEIRCSNVVTVDSRGCSDVDAELC